MVNNKEFIYSLFRRPHPPPTRTFGFNISPTPHPPARTLGFITGWDHPPARTFGFKIGPPHPPTRTFCFIANGHPPD